MACHSATLTLHLLLSSSLSLFLPFIPPLEASVGLATGHRQAVKQRPETEQNCAGQMPSKTGSFTQSTLYQPAPARLELLSYVEANLTPQKLPSHLLEAYRSDV